MKWLIIANIGLLILNFVLLIHSHTAKETDVYFVSTSIYNTDSLITMLNKRQGILESAFINLQQVYWNRHKRDRKCLLPYVKLFCDEKAARKLNTRMRLR